MTTPNPDTNDLSSLVDAANREVSRVATPRVQRKQHRFNVPVSLLFAIALAGAAAFGAYQVFAYYAVPTVAKVGEDLAVAVDRARDSVEEVRKSTGALPESLPNAALASVVTYEARNTEYRLSASVGGVRVAIEWDGSKTVGKEMTK